MGSDKSKPSLPVQDDSEHEVEEELEYIERKEDKVAKDHEDVSSIKEEKNTKGSGDKKAENELEKNKQSKEDKEKEKEKEKSLAQEIKAAMTDQNEKIDADEPGTFYERSAAIKTHSIWSIDVWLRDSLIEWNPIFSYIIEILVVGFILVIPSVYWLFKEWKKIDFRKFFESPSTMKIGDPELVFRFSLFTFIWYFFDLLVMIVCDSTLLIMNTILNFLQLSESEFIWSIVATVYTLRTYIRISVTCTFVFYLSILMFSKFQRPKSFDLADHNTYKILILWAGLYSAMQFIAMFILSICIYDMKRSSYKDAIWGLNHKIFIFKKLDKIGKAENKSEKDEICRNEKAPFDPGFYLKDSNFFVSEEDAQIVANNILYRLKKTKLEYKDINEYFPGDSELVYSFLSGMDDDSEKTGIKASTFINRAKELYLKRKDMQKTLVDRNYIFDMLESLVSLLVFYLAAIVLCFLFDINYQLYIVGLGSTLLTFSWVFADTIKKIFICFVFVLLVKPYDIGDRVNILNLELKVHKINLLHTTFLNLNKTVCYMSNDVLFNTPIYNFARSPSQCIEIEITPKDIVSLNDAKSIEKVAQEKIKSNAKNFSGVELSQKTDVKIKFMVSLKKNMQDELGLIKKKAYLMKMFDEVLTEANVPHKSSYNFIP